MSVKEFWEDDPSLFWAYRFSYIKKLKGQQELNNYNNWLQGAYFYEAISVALSNAFGGKAQYSSCPYGTKQNQNKETPKQNSLDNQLKERAMKIAMMLGGEKNNAK